MDGGTMVAYLELDAAGYRQAMSQAEQEARRFAAALSALSPGASSLAVGGEGLQVTVLLLLIERG